MGRVFFIDITALFDEFQKMSPVGQSIFLNLIYPIIKSSSDKVSDYIETIREIRFSKGTFFPHCKSKHIIRHGKYRSRQYYKCKECGKTFNNISCIPMAGTHHPQKWAKYIQFIAEGTTLPKIAKALYTSLSIAFYWRHKVLNSLLSMSIEQLSSIVESDETFFIESFKGKNQCKTRKPNKRGGECINLRFNGVAAKYIDNYLLWHRFLQLNKSLDKIQLKKTLLTNVLAMNKSTVIKDLRPIKQI